MTTTATIPAGYHLATEDDAYSLNDLDPICPLCGALRHIAPGVWEPCACPDLLWSDKAEQPVPAGAASTGLAA